MSRKIISDRHSEGIARALSEQERRKASDEAAGMTPKDSESRRFTPLWLILGCKCY